MPCGDISETVEIRLDAEDRLRSLRVAKATCGADVGAEGLLAHLAGRKADDLAALSEAALLPGDGARRRFLVDKQLRALRAALRVYLGECPGGPDAPFVLVALDVAPDGTVIRGRHRPGVDAARVPPCRTCACGG